MSHINFIKAQNGDCFLLSFNDNEGLPRNILIDGGREEAYYDSSTNLEGELFGLIDIIKDKNQRIDLLVLTHIDNDHICGLLQWFEMDKDAYALIDNVWFNSGKLIAEYLEMPDNPDLRLDLKIFGETNTGVTEAIDFEKYLCEKKIWKRKIILKGDTLNELGVQIQVLSPDRQQLEKLLKEYRRVLGKDAYTGSRVKDWNVPLKKFIEEESNGNFKFQQDTSVKNGSSISFILTIAQKKFLFLGDSHPKPIVEALKELTFSEENRLEVEFIKLSHHGSKGNTNNELLKLVKTDNYIISTDSSGHNHPSKRTLARIVNINPNAIFHFNYEFVKDNIMLESDFVDFPKMKIKLSNYL